MNNQYEIRKAGGILIKERKVLVEKSFNKEFYNAPGGKIEEGESPETALIRELYEELSIKIVESDLNYFGVYSAIASGQNDKRVHMHVFQVAKWEGAILPSHEVEKIMWVDSKLPQEIKVGSIFAHNVIPQLKQLKLID